MLHYYDISIQGQKDRQTDMKCYGFNHWIGGFGVYSILWILDQDDLYKELTREAVF